MGERHDHQRAEPDAGQIEKPLREDRPDRDAEVRDDAVGEEREPQPDERHTLASPEDRREKSEPGCHQDSGQSAQLTA